MGFFDLLKKITGNDAHKSTFEPEKLHPIPSSGCDPLLRSAADLVMSGCPADPQTLQSKLKIGYSHACRLLSQLEEIGLIEHFTGIGEVQVLGDPSIGYPSLESDSYELLVSKMEEWKRLYLIDNSSRTSERQKATLQILLQDPSHDLYMLSVHGSACPVCAPLEGRVYSRSGTDPDFPPLAMAFQKIDPEGPDVLWNTYLIPHQDCRHCLIIWTPAGRTAEEINEIKRFSSPITNPFSRDPRTLKQIEFFNRAVEGRRRWKESFDLFQECQSLGIENFPKTFQTFQKHQSENSAKYQDWMNQREHRKGLVMPRASTLITVRTERVDPDEDLKTPAWAELSYLDAQALEFWNGKPTDFQIPSYYADTAFGRNVGPALSRLLKGGYLQRGSVQKSIERKTIPELKAILAEKELKLSGKKGELVQRLLNNVPPDELEELFPVGVYEATEKGWRARDQYEIVFENQAYGLGFSYYRLLEERERRPRDGAADILTSLLSKEIAECYRTGDRSRYQELLPKAARFMDGNGDPLKALEVSVLSYFVWTMEVKTLSAQGLAHGADMQNPYLSRNVEEYARKCGLTFDQLLEHFAVTVRENKPFALSSEANIRYAQDMLKRGLSISQ